MSNLNDSDLLLALCIHEEGLPDPADFVARLRAALQTLDTVPETAEDAEALRAVWDGLRDEAEAARIAARKISPVVDAQPWPFSG
jgi:hypothetical protein